MRASETGEASGVVARDLSRRFSLLAYGGLAVLAYVPLLLTAPGRVAADTRALIYLDPGGFVPRALSLWDTSTHLGTVTHQNLGLAFPMGAWFWLTDTIGIPVWIAQRLWLGSILFAAGAGVLYLARARFAGPARVRWSQLLCTCSARTCCSTRRAPRS